MKKKYILLIILLLMIAVTYSFFFSSNVNVQEGKKYLYIRTGSNYEYLIQEIKDSQLIENISTFKLVASLFSLSQNIHPGRYELKNGMGNYSIIKMLKQGHQTPVNLVINKLRTKQDIIKKFSSQLEADKSQWEKLFLDSLFLAKNDIDSNQIQILILPNTYQVYWNTKPEKVMDKFITYKNKFWNETRINKAKNLNLTPNQVSIIASIVDEETNKNDEKPMVASVYINRYRKGMKLEADPTVKFAVGDFSLRRILNIHLKTASPYNTYLNTGLPPGPICTPSEKSIDAVLDAKETNYLFFCAKEDFSGYHNFASTYSEHLTNAKKFQNALNQRGIK